MLLSTLHFANYIAGPCKNESHFNGRMKPEECQACTKTLERKRLLKIMFLSVVLSFLSSLYSRLFPISLSRTLWEGNVLVRIVTHLRPSYCAKPEHFQLSLNLHSEYSRISFPLHIFYCLLPDETSYLAVTFNNKFRL